MSTRLTRLQRLESLETAKRFPTVIETHDCIPVAADDRRRGSYVIEANQITFYCSSAAEYQEASAAYSDGRHIIVISLDHRCLDFPQQEGTRNDC